MSLQIRRLKITVKTEAGLYGVDMALDNGLVIIRADNTSGKSTCIKSIIYALGLERMFGPGAQPPLPPVLTKALEDKVEIPVLESHVYLEIFNGTHSITVQRQIVGSTGRDWRLISVWEKTLDTISTTDIPKHFYVRDPGAATREDGFHPYLASFIGWQMPLVQRFNGDEVPFYMECILPLFYIEQKNGWSSIQATTPRYFQIKNVDKRSIEFILDLDAFRFETARQSLLQKEAELLGRWKQLQNQFEHFLFHFGGRVRNLHPEPFLSWPPEAPLTTEILIGDKFTDLESAVSEIELRLRDLGRNVIPTAQQVTEETKEKLQFASRELDESDFLVERLEQEYQSEESEKVAIQSRLNYIEEDLRKNQDVEKLRQYGAASNLRIATSHCPTCDQVIADSLIPQVEKQNVMNLEENINYLRSQKRTLDSILKRTISSATAKAQRVAAAKKKNYEIRLTLRSLKDTLTSQGSAPSVAAIREQMTLEQRAGDLKALRENIITLFSVAEEISGDWIFVQSNKKKIAEKNSRKDMKKLETLKEIITDQLKQYGFKSFNPDAITLSFDDYHPTRDGFDIVYDTSASDNIRVIVSYATGLLELARAGDTNHPGLLLLDEPRQQSLHWGSFKEVFQRLCSSGAFNQQVILATSEPEDTIKSIIADKNVQLISFVDKIITPMEY